MLGSAAQFIQTDNLMPNLGGGDSPIITGQEMRLTRFQSKSDGLILSSKCPDSDNADWIGTALGIYKDCTLLGCE